VFARWLPAISVMSVVKVAVYCVLTASQVEGVKVTSAPLQLRVPLTIVFEGSRTTNVVLFTDDEDKVSLNDTLIAALIGSAASFTPGWSISLMAVLCQGRPRSRSIGAWRDNISSATVAAPGR